MITLEKSFEMLANSYGQRKITKGSIITVKAMKRNNIMLLTDYGRSILFKPDSYTNEIKLLEWRFWILNKQNNTVIKSIPAK